ncbi:olfactory receptor 10C1-like [Hemicordylus capensis]|uniref:olfactory receptor 10C1-like n=1 Tax=Hemicordylus capensis TaxID=884348 RepID=UPI0023039243|nr:olfactory receptor 10C1-like [Hemicordylus capensis]
MNSQENVTAISCFILAGFPEAHKFRFLIFSVLLSLYIITLMTNILIILTVKSDPILNTPMYFFLMHLAYLEVCYMSVIIPKLLETLLVDSEVISFLECAIQMFLFLFFGVAECFLLAAMAFDRYVAICHPLRYMTIMSRSTCWKMVTGSYIFGSIVGLIHTTVTFQLPFCGVVINHFFCEIQPLLGLVCNDTFINEVQVIGVAMLAIMLPFFLIILSYTGIIITLTGMSSLGSRHKAFSTCTSHLIVVILFYGTAGSMYLKPKSCYSPSVDKLLSFSYTIATPLLNPIIYSLKNKEIQGALKKLRRKMVLLQIKRW